jgi:drug/metabolite transporter (DMT)-like permease
MSGISVMVGDSLSSGSFFGNVVALAIPINFSILVMIIRKNKNLDMVPAIFYSGIFSIMYGLILSESFVFTGHDILMGFFLGVPQLAFGFICITIGSRSTPSATIGLLMLTETIFGPIWVWLFLNEIPPVSVFIGGGIIILAIILKSLDKTSAAT